MKNIILLLLMALSLPSWAQTNPTEAKAAYLLAEESYGKSDYKAALSYLDEAKKNMGRANSKMLFLQIQTELELLKTDKSYYEKVLSTIMAFENAADYKTFNDDKKLEVTKVKIQLRAEQKRAAQEEASRERKVIAAKKAYAEFTIKGWPVNLLLSELQANYKDDPFFKDGLESLKDFKYNLQMHYPANLRSGTFAQYRLLVLENKFVNTPGLFGILTQSGKVKGYTSLEMMYDYRANENGMSYEKAGKEFETLLAKYTELFGFAPKKKLQPANKFYVTDDYIWESPEKKVILEHEYGPSVKDATWLVAARSYVIYK